MNPAPEDIGRNLARQVFHSRPNSTVRLDELQLRELLTLAAELALESVSDVTRVRGPPEALPKKSGRMLIISGEELGTISMREVLLRLEVEDPEIWRLFGLQK